MAFRTTCLRPADSSVLTCVKYPSKSIKSLLRRKIFKKSSALSKFQSPIERPNESNCRLQRIKGSNFIQEVTPNNQTMHLSNNYDMAVFHDDEFDDTQLALSDRRSKKIPRWARKSQLELAIVNQTFYNDKQPEDIFGSVQLELAHEMIESIQLWNREFRFAVSNTNLPRDREFPFVVCNTHLQ